MKRLKQQNSKLALPKVGVGWYREDQWNLLLEHAADRDKLEETYGEWLEVARKGMKNLTKAEVQFEKIPIDVEELIKWCREKGCAVDGSSRSEFIALKTREKSCR